MSKETVSFGADKRLKKLPGEAVRGNRDMSDASRTDYDGSALSAEERRMALRRDWVQEILPTPPSLPGFHCCWLSTTNSTDPIYKRIQRGYIPVTQKEVPGFGAQYTVTGGEFDGCIACNEMLLFKLPLEVYADLMTIYHHDMPSEQEEAIHERVSNSQQFDSTGRPLASVEGEFQRMGTRTQAPTFS